MIPFAGVILKTLLGPISDLAGKYIENQTSREKFKADLEGVLAVQSTELAKVQSSVIIAETQSEDWLTHNWRPIVALTAFFSCWFVVFPYAFFVKWGLLPQVFFGEKGLEYFFTLTTLCVGGYIGGRSVEKVSTTIIGRAGKQVPK